MENKYLHCFIKEATLLINCRIREKRGRFATNTTTFRKKAFLQKTKQANQMQSIPDLFQKSETKNISKQTATGMDIF